MTETPDGYQLPSLDLLAEPVTKDLSGENKRLKDNATKLIATLKSFGIGAKVLKIHLGPSVTKYEIEPDQGIKLSRITGLADDLALRSRPKISGSKHRYPVRLPSESRFRTARSPWFPAGSARGGECPGRPGPLARGTWSKHFREKRSQRN